jgi:hypothetical protein
MMNRDHLKGQWQQVDGTSRAGWSALADDEIQVPGANMLLAHPFDESLVNDF